MRCLATCDFSYSLPQSITKIFHYNITFVCNKNNYLCKKIILYKPNKRKMKKVITFLILFCLLCASITVIIIYVCRKEKSKPANEIGNQTYDSLCIKQEEDHHLKSP
jgi:hypothetical protein